MCKDRILTKSGYDSSYFLLFELYSKTSAKLFCSDPMYNDKPVKVLQIMHVGDESVICEILPTYKHEI